MRCRALRVQQHDLRLHSLLLLIGFTAAFIITIFPFKPRSAKTSIRLSCAKVIDLASGLFAAEVEGVLEGAVRNNEGYDHNLRASQHRATVLLLMVSRNKVDEWNQELSHTSKDSFAKHRAVHGSSCSRTKYEGAMAAVQVREPSEARVRTGGKLELGQQCMVPHASVLG